MAQPGAVPSKISAREPLRLSPKRMVHAATSVERDGHVIGVIAGGNVSLFQPVHTPMSVFVASSSHVNIRIAPAPMMLSPILVAPPTLPVSDPLRRVWADDDRVREQGTGRRTEFFHHTRTPDNKYEISEARVDNPNGSTLEVSPGCCERFKNWICCKP